MLRIPEGGLERAEWVAGLALTAVAVYLHVRCLTRAGPLWRDEANTVAVATRASWGAVAGALEHESFPILPFAVVRVWRALGIGGTDFGLRVLGFLVGAGILGALWLDAALLGARVPLLALSLFALNPLVIRWGDSLRGYGMGTLLFLILYGAVFRACKRPDAPRILGAAAVALLAVQCMYQNALLLFTTGVAAVLASGAARRLRVIGAACGIGAVAAASLLPYLGVIARARDHFVVMTLPRDPSRIRHALLATLGRTLPGMGFAGEITSTAWLLLYAVAIGFGIAFLVRHGTERGEENESCAYGLAVLLLAPIAILAFLNRVSFQTGPWYFVLLLGAVAVSLDTVFGALTRTAFLRAARVAFACAVAAIAISPTDALLEARQTNVDLVAKELERQARPEDLIVVDPWFYAVSFNRYYHGQAPWITIPLLADREIHRFDLLKEQMTLSDPVRPILERAATTLRSGHVVWIVGLMILFPPGQIPKTLPPAPSGPDGWYSDPYLVAWRTELGSFLRTYGGRGDGVSIPADAPVNPYEEMPLWRIEGWVDPG